MPLENAERISERIVVLPEPDEPGGNDDEHYRSGNSRPSHWNGRESVRISQKTI